MWTVVAPVLIAEILDWGNWGPRRPTLGAPNGAQSPDARRPRGVHCAKVTHFGVKYESEVLFSLDGSKVRIQE